MGGMPHRAGTGVTNVMTLVAGAAENVPVPTTPTLVVVVSPVDLSADLGLTVLWRSDVQRVMVSSADAAIEVAQVRRPTMVVVGGISPKAAAECAQRLRAHPATRGSAMAVL